MMLKNKLGIKTRWMLRKDLSRILGIESTAYDLPWSEEDFLSRLRNHNTIGMVVEYNHAIVGYVIYQIICEKLILLNLTISTSFHRQGFGTQLMEKMKQKLKYGRHKILIDVNEYNLDAQLFLRNCGFVCVGIKKKEDLFGDAYSFCFERLS